MSMLAQSPRLQFVTGLPDSPKIEAKGVILAMGDIALPVKAEPVTQQVLFSIVEDLGPYNAIISRSWMHTMKAVPSTYHQTISYLTSAGQIDLLCSQLAARQCYQL